jgi:hypothetical protein
VLIGVDKIILYKHINTEDYIGILHQLPTFQLGMFQVKKLFS